ncbi:UNVERIFIED_CONTAM: hypothetical protein Cloal_3887 [Acetivibrio alkalicellulosi]
MKKKACAVFNIIALLISLIIRLFIISYFGRFLIQAICVNYLQDMTAEVLAEDRDFRFNRDGRIKYRHLSDQLKEYVTKEEFNSIKTWYDAYNVFVEGVDETHSYFSEGYKSSRASWRFPGMRVNFVDTFWGMKIDYIYIDPSYVDLLNNLNEDE